MKNLNKILEIEVYEHINVCDSFCIKKSKKCKKEKKTFISDFDFVFNSIALNWNSCFARAPDSLVKFNLVSNSYPF